jgi:glyoxylate utilization-related uncharacterized protein
MTKKWETGNAVEAGKDTRGWILGHFIDPAHGVRSTADLEIKWATHPVGDKRAQWTEDERRTTLVILISGRFTVELERATVTLARQGDYVTWGPGIEHAWQAEENSVVLTVRWPSLSG